MADMAVVFGILPPKLGYDDYVGLAMNLGRAQMRQTFAVAQGVAFGMSEADLPVALFDGVADTADQAAEMALEANTERALQRAWRRAKRGER